VDGAVLEGESRWTNPMLTGKAFRWKKRRRAQVFCGNHESLREPFVSKPRRWERHSCCANIIEMVKAGRRVAVPLYAGWRNVVSGWFTAKGVLIAAQLHSRLGLFFAPFAARHGQTR